MTRLELPPMPMSERPVARLDLDQLTGGRVVSGGHRVERRGSFARVRRLRDLNSAIWIRGYRPPTVWAGSNQTGTAALLATL
jgi:hypothetical protein